ncbi:MAG: hypothetical protein LBU60_00995 [Clostridiales bacterium]|nr:hypothetical protein [Clostridiales bacterium]
MNRNQSRNHNSKSNSNKIIILLAVIFLAVLATILISNFTKNNNDNKKQSLQTPTNLSIDSNGLLSWDKVEHAKSYIVNDNTTELNSTNDNHYSLIGLGIGQYRLKVKAISADTDYSDSNWSAICEYEIKDENVLPLGTPNIVLNGSVVSWNAVANATHYTVSINSDIYDTMQPSYSLNSITQFGTYTIRVKAKSEDNESSWSNSVEYVLNDSGGEKPGGGGSSPDGNDNGIFFINETPNEGPATIKEPGEDTSPEAAKNRFSQYLSKADFEYLFPLRFGCPLWKQTESPGMRYSAEQIAAMPDYYSYENFLKAMENLANLIYIVEYRTDANQSTVAGYAPRHSVYNKNTKKTTIITTEPDFNAEWNINKPSLQMNIDFGAFLNKGTENDKRRELAGFLANISHETSGGWPTAVPDEIFWGLYFNEEVAFLNGGIFGNGGSNPNFPPQPGKSYHGRGPIQLTHDYNYGLFSTIYFGDGMELLKNPERVSQEGDLGIASAIWFWMTPQWPKASCHQVMTNQWTPHPSRPQDSQYTQGFGLSIIIINGGLEGNLTEDDGRIRRRVLHYRTTAEFTKADIVGEKLDTLGMTGWA